MMRHHKERLRQNQGNISTEPVTLVSETFDQERERLDWGAWLGDLEAPGQLLEEGLPRPGRRAQLDGQERLSPLHVVAPPLVDAQTGGGGRHDGPVRPA